MKILVACEYSGIVRDTFKRHGHDVYSVDTEPGEGQFPELHIQAPVEAVIKSERWDMLIAFPPCRFLSVACPENSPDFLADSMPMFEWRLKSQLRAVRFVEMLWQSGISHICLENPVGYLPRLSHLGPPTMVFSPTIFGDDRQKRTCFWLRNLPTLFTELKGPLFGEPDGYPNTKWRDQTSGHYPEKRSKERSKFHAKTAEAMAKQWSEI